MERKQVVCGSNHYFGEVLSTLGCDGATLLGGGPRNRLALRHIFDLHDPFAVGGQDKQNRRRHHAHHQRADPADHVPGGLRLSAIRRHGREPDLRLHQPAGDRIRDVGVPDLGVLLPDGLLLLRDRAAREVL